VKNYVCTVNGTTTFTLSGETAGEVAARIRRDGKAGLITSDDHVLTIDPAKIATLDVMVMFRVGGSAEVQPPPAKFKPAPATAPEVTTRS